MAIIRRLIRRCFVSGGSVDDKDYQTAQVSAYGKPVNADVLNLYGIASNVPENAPGVLFLTNAQEDNRFAILGNSPEWRPRNLKSGELVIGNFITGDVVRFLETGIEIVGNKDLDVNITGNVNVNVTGETTINSTGNVSVNTSGVLDVLASSTINLTAPNVNCTVNNFNITAAVAFNVSAPVANFTTTNVNLGVGGLPIARVGDSVDLLTGLILPNGSTNTST